MLEESRKSVDIRWYIVRLTKFKLKFLLTLFFFFYLLSWELGLGMTSLSQCHKSHNMVTATVTGHKIAIEESKRF